MTLYVSYVNEFSKCICQLTRVLHQNHHSQNKVCNALWQNKLLHFDSEELSLCQNYKLVICIMRATPHQGSDCPRETTRLHHFIRRASCMVLVLAQRASQWISLQLINSYIHYISYKYIFIYDSPKQAEQHFNNMTNEEHAFIWKVIVS